MNQLSIPRSATERHTGEQHSEEGARLFQEIFEHAPFAVCVSGLDKRFLHVNGALCAMLGYSAEELTGTPWTELTHPDDLGTSLETMKQLLQKECKYQEVEKRLLHRSGASVWVRMRISLVRDSCGVPLFFAVHMEDITEPKRIREALREGEERFRIMADSCPSMMWVTDAQGDIQFINKASREFCGIEPEEMNRSKWELLTHPKDAPEYVAAFNRAVRKRTPFSAEARVRRGDGEWRLVGSRAKASLSSSGEYLGHIGLSADITDRIQAEQTRQFELSLIRSIHDETREGILVVDGGGRIVSLNKRFLEIWQITAPTATGPVLDGSCGAMDRQFLLEALERVEAPEAFNQRIQELYDHPDEEDHCEIKLKNGGVLERHSKGLRSQEGTYLGRVWFFRDITEQKKTEVSLKNLKDLAFDANRRLIEKRTVLENERRMLRALIDNIPDFMYVKDTQSRIVVANSHFSRMLGVESPEELLGKTDFDLYPQDLANAFYQDEQNVIRSGSALYNHEERGLNGEGEETSVLTTKVPIRDSNGQVTGIAGVGRDISARKRMEDALREAERKYRGIFDNAIVGIFQSTPGGRFLSVNSAMSSTFGYDSPEEMIAGVTDISNQLYADPDRRAEILRLMRTIGGVHNFDVEALRRDGSRIWVSMSVRTIFEDGITVRFEGMCEDITERHLLRQQLLQAQKLESVGQLAAGIAHEINTPTQYIGDNVRFLKDAFRDLTSLLASYEQLLLAAQGTTLSCEAIDEAATAVERTDARYLLEEIPKAIDQTLEGVTRVSTLVNAMKEFSHPSTKEAIPLDLNHAIESTITVARNEWKYVADMVTDFDRSLPPIPCQPGEFNQVILNLIVNAAHAIGEVARNGGAEKGRITVQTRNCDEWAEVRIQDTGTGIPECIRNRIFDPFFTTKEIGKGTGQGLAIAHSAVVVKHGGTIRFETEEGKGTTFIIRLPRDGAPLSTKVAAS